MAKVDILEVFVDNVDFDQALCLVEKFVSDGQKHYIVTPNPEQIIWAQKHSRFRKILNKADLAICDGIGLLWASRFLKKPLTERVSGIDLLEKLCQKASQKGWKVGFLGASGEIAKQAAGIFEKRYQGLKVEFAKEGNPSPVFDRQIRKEIPKLDLLFVAYGAPKQEEWIDRNLKNLDVGVVMAVGGAFDFATGRQKRAPKIWRQISLEWLWRLIWQPWRLKRQMAIPVFILRVFRQRFS